MFRKLNVLLAQPGQAVFNTTGGFWGLRADLQALPLVILGTDTKSKVKKVTDEIGTRKKKRKRREKRKIDFTVRMYYVQ